jgi:hypothetical protein
MPSGPPPSYPQEHYPEHRKFLLRSLDRNDTDLAVLIELNRTLKKVKMSIINECGEAVLLDLGEGILKLSPGEDSLEGGSNLPEEAQDLCVDFLLRMKLRRKLLNRLARRLNRVAHAMDGEDVAPPPPPKYGDLRLHIDARAVEVYAEHWKRQAEAQQRIAMSRYRSVVKSEWTPEEEAAHQKKYASDEDREEEMKTDETEETNLAVPMDTQVEEKTAEIEDKPEDEGTEPKEKPANTDTQVGEANEGKKITEGKQLVSEANPDAAKSKPDVAESLGEPTEEEEDYALEQDYEVLKTYTGAYERVLDPATGTFKYTILDQEHEEDYQAIKYGAGIGATHRSMSSKEKEMEAKRWQAAILNRIPEQPTFEMLGLENRVFELEERRKRLVESESASPLKKKSKQDDSDDDTDSEDVDEEEREEENVAASPIKTKTEDKKSPKKQDGATKSTDVVATKRVKAMSLAAVPTFYEQDLQRIRLVHADLMETSIHDHARSRLTEATNDYNAAFRMSNELYDRRNLLQNQLNNILMDSRAKLAKLKNDYALQVAIERSRWLKRKEQFDAKRMQALMPTRMGRHPVGTPYISSYARSCRDRNNIFVAECMGDMVDAVVTIRDNKLKGFEDFVPPPPPDLTTLVEDQSTGETFTQRQARIEQNLKKELHVLSIKLQASEDERRRAWRKMLKIKAEFEAPSQRYYLGPSRERISVDSNNYHLHPVPALRSSSAAAMPQPMPLSNSTVGSYTPNPSSLPSSAHNGTSMSKYSAARVRERISDDGTVAPVSEPKKTKDGLYQRPAGRTRKGMTWDAVRGIWVPANES